MRIGWSVACVLVAGCYESHPLLPPPCFPGEATLVIAEGDGCTDMTVEPSRTDVSCSTGEGEPGWRGTPYRVVNLSAIGADLRFTVVDDTASLFTTDTATCRCVTSGSHPRGLVAGSCFGQIRLEPGATFTGAFSTDGAAARFEACPATDSPATCTGASL